MAKVYEIEGIIPVVDPSAYVHPSAVLIGDVIVGSRCYVGPGACLRGDFGRVVLEEGANIQDTCVMHGFPGIDTVVEKDGHIGHGAVLHSCRVGRNAMVGMNAVVMDGAVIGEASIVAAMTFVKAKFEVPPRTLVAGIPGRIIRELSDQEIAWKSEGTASYHALALRSLKSMREAEALNELNAERERQRIQMEAEIDPLYKAKLKFSS